MAGAQGLVCIFAKGEDRCFAPSSRREQQSTGLLHLDYSSPIPRRKRPTTKVVGRFLAGAQGLEP